MPWSTNNYPASMKNLPEAQRAKAISIANAILREGGDEGIAIATGIKKAKELEKVASTEFDKIKHIWNYGKSKNRFLLPLAGTAIGAGLTYNRTKNNKKPVRIAASIANGISGGILGAQLHMFTNAARFREGFKASKQVLNKDFIKKYKLPYKSISTKKQAKEFHRQLVKKYHPDLGGSVNQMQELNKDWEDFQKTDFFNKLAAISKQQVLKTLMKDHILIPGVAGLASGAIAGTAMKYKDNKQRALKIGGSALASGLISAFLGKKSIKKHMLALKDTVQNNKKIENDFKEALKAYHLKHASKKETTPGNTDAKLSLAAGIGMAGSPLYKDKIRLTKAQKFIEIPDPETKTISYDFFEGTAKAKMLRKLKLMSYVNPFVTGGLTYGLLKAKRKFFPKKQEDTK